MNRHNFINFFMLTFCILCNGCSGKKEYKEIDSTFKTNVDALIQPESSIISLTTVGEYDSVVEKYKGFDFSADSAYVTNAENKQIAFKALMTEYDYIGRYSVYNCTDCIGHMIESLSRYNARHPKEKMAIIIKGAWYRDLHVYNNNHKNKFVFYSADNLPTDYDEYFEPYFIKSNKSRIDYMFIPLPELQERTHRRLGI